MKVEWLASPSRRLAQGKRVHGTRWAVVWVGPRGVLPFWRREESLAPAGIRTPSCYAPWFCPPMISGHGTGVTTFSTKRLFKNSLYHPSSPIQLQGLMLTNKDILLPSCCCEYLFHHLISSLKRPINCYFPVKVFMIDISCIIRAAIPLLACYAV